MTTMKDTLGVLLAGGAGERLYPLTRDRAKPAVTFGGIYRIIDITLSNCVNSDLRRVFILTQYKALSLSRHIREGWNIVAREMGEFVEILPPMKRVSDNWYMGTADAVYQNIYSIGSEQPKHVLILSGDHIYKMNYGRMLRHHRDSGADVTLATILIEPDETFRFGVVEMDRDGTTSATTSCRKWSTTTASSPSISSTKIRRKPFTGAMWERWRLITTRTWTSFLFRPFSICTIQNGQFAHTSGSILQPSSSSENRVVPALPLIPSCLPAASFPAAR